MHIGGVLWDSLMVGGGGKLGNKKREGLSADEVGQMGGCVVTPCTGPQAVITRSKIKGPLASVAGLRRWWIGGAVVAGVSCWPWIAGFLSD